MESSDVSKVSQQAIQEIASASANKSTVFWFVIINILFAVVFAIILGFTNIKHINENWPKYRCNPAIMPFVSFFGRDTTENFNYCTGNVFSGIAGQVTGPFATIFTSIIGILMGLVKNINSLRLMFSSMMGGIVKIVREFKDRFRYVQNEVRRSVTRMQFLMGRVFSTMYAMIFMGTSAITAGMNFGDTALFKFLDTFCFDPDTPVHVQGKGPTPIKHVSLGDVLENGAIVTSVYQFYSDGQPMMKFYDSAQNPILVSTNHYVQYKGKWVMAEKHPEAVPAGDWTGGTQRPLICLDTNTHTIPIGGYIFSDYDETMDSDASTMIWAENTLNNTTLSDNDESHKRSYKYEPCMDKNMEVQMKDGTYKKLGDLVLGDELHHGRVGGIVERHVYETVIHGEGYHVTPSTLYWDEGESRWLRAGIARKEAGIARKEAGIARKEAGIARKDSIITHTKPITLRSIVVLSSATIVTKHGTVYRDFVEVHSHDLEAATSMLMERHVPE